MGIHPDFHTISPAQYAAYLAENRTIAPGTVLIITDESSRPAEMVFGNGLVISKCVRLRVLVWDQSATSIAAILDAISALETVSDDHEDRITTLESGGAGGDVVGPAGGTAVGEIPLFADNTGKVIAGSGILLSTITDHIADTANPHGVTKAQVGLSAVDNTSDADKPVSTATQTALDGKQSLDADLTAIAALASNGLITRTGAGTAAVRSVAVTASTGLSVSNGDGVSGNPTLAGLDSTTAVKGVLELATAAEYRTGTDTARGLGVAETWASAAVFALTDGATIAVSFANGFNFGGASEAVLALGGNRTLGAPTNLKSGQTGILWFGASGSTRTLTLNAAWNLATGVEAGPYSITTAQELGVAYVIRGSTVVVTAIIRRG